MTDSSRSRNRKARPGSAAWMDEIRQRLQRTEEELLRRGPFPPSYRVSERVNVSPDGCIWGIVTSVKTRGHYHIYEVAVFMPDSGEFAIPVSVMEQDPGVLVIDDPNELFALEERLQGAPKSVSLMN